MRVRTPGRRWFDERDTFKRHCAALREASPRKEQVPMSVVDVDVEFQKALDEDLERKRLLALFYPLEP